MGFCKTCNGVTFNMALPLQKWGCNFAISFGSTSATASHVQPNGTVFPFLLGASMGNLSQGTFSHSVQVHDPNHIHLIASFE